MPKVKRVKTRTYQMGQVIKIDKKHHAAINEKYEAISLARVGYTEALKHIRAAEHALWGYLNKMNPKMKGYKVNMDWEKYELTILGVADPNVSIRPAATKRDKLLGKV